MNVFKGTLLRISQTDTLLQTIAMANLDPSAENASAGAWTMGDFFWDVGNWNRHASNERKVHLVSAASIQIVNVNCFVVSFVLRICV